MSENPIELSRRKILAGIGAAGVASVGAGLGTSAYFSDNESFDGNTLTAGELDMHVGWEEHYSDWSDDEGDGISSIEMVGPNETANSSRVGLPLGADTAINGSMVTVENVSQAHQFLNNTETSPNGTYSNTTDFDPMTVSGDPCQYLADGAEQSPVIIDLDDVKPGDFGEITFSFALCDNPGYVWMSGALESASENGLNEPEMEDPDEDQTINSTGDVDPADGDVELLDTVRAAGWYDDGDNLQSGGTEEAAVGAADIAFILDRSNSMSDERNFLQNEISGLATQISQSGVDAQYALVPYEDTTSGSCPTFIATNLTADETNLDFTYGTCGGNEDASEAISYALDNLNWRSNAQKILVVLTDEDDDGNQSQRTTALNKIDNENACLLAVSEGGSQPNDLQQMAASVNCGDWVQIDDGLSQDNLNDFVSFVGGVTGGEPVFVQGTLREVLNALSSGLGVPLNGDIEAAAGGGMSERNCYSASTHHNVGFAWWLPVDHANEIQTDTAEFSLGFYTEQCRHNDGSGQPAETTSGGTNQTNTTTQQAQ
ncbi:vWA domain-containing protein [Haloarchaeobius sp. FL176]|uniref:vWA domain-containing protein n=1 Tax=Haloarchaeobius sp. FL176 TaxID=2967129 RepID=UPI002147754E|nr:vWA domain-containing protein [Haloarchaeobius sp. FL176]